MTKEEAIRRIKSWNLDSDDMEVLSVVIPELAESEDEKIRKELINYLTHRIEVTTLDEDKDCKSWIAYIEELPTNEEMLRTLRVEYEKGVADTIAKYEQKESGAKKEEIKNYLKDNLRMEWECHSDGNYYMVLKVAGEKICQLNFGEGY